MGRMPRQNRPLPFSQPYEINWDFSMSWYQIPPSKILQYSSFLAPTSAKTLWQWRGRGKLIQRRGNHLRSGFAQKDFPKLSQVHTSEGMIHGNLKDVSMVFLYGVVLCDWSD